MSTAWTLLVLAGLFEVAWAVGLKFTHGFTRLMPSLWVAGAICASLWLLAQAQRTLPISLAYPVWMGIGAAGTVIIGAIFLREALSPPGWCFLALLLVSLVGLKVWG
jgi:quaternary ammonium compound-resistance protein SugE